MSGKVASKLMGLWKGVFGPRQKGNLCMALPALKWPLPTGSVMSWPTCMTDLSARAPVAVMHAVKPMRLKEGSKPVLITMPSMRGMRVL